MSETTTPPSRPVPLIAALFILALFGVFYVVVRKYYTPAAASPQNTVAENLSKDLEWKATPATRRDTLKELREKEAKQASSYAWVDKPAGVVQLPIERAMQLTAEKYGQKK